MCYILLSFTLNVIVSFYLYAGKYGGEEDVQGVFHTWKKKIRTATEIKLGVSKKYMESAQQHCLYLKDRIKNINDSDAIQPHKIRIDTENDEKVYKFAYRIPD